MTDITPDKQEVTNKSEMVKAPYPAVTETQKEEVRTLLGADFIALHPQYGPDSIKPYSNNGAPAYAMGMLQIELPDFEKDKSWDSAWKYLISELPGIKEMAERRSKIKKII